MAKYYKALTRKVLQKQLERSGIAWARPLTKSIWNEFMLWSQIDEEKHENINTLEDWQDEWAEFDACYEDWKGEQN
jgi:hypothetical protein